MRGIMKTLAITVIATLALSISACAHTREIESQRKFWVWDLTVMPPSYRHPEFSLQSNEKLKSTGEDVRIWVEKDLAAHTPSEKAVQDLMDILVKRTPEQSLNPSLGALDLERRYFGVDKIGEDLNLIIAALPPFQKCGKKFGHDGYFNPYDQVSEEEALQEGQHSNEKNILYANALEGIDTPYMQGVLVHELAHLLTFKRIQSSDKPIEEWLNELLGEAAMLMTGFYTDEKHVEKYRKETRWPIAASGYGISYGGLASFSEFLIKKYDPALVGRLASLQGSGFDRMRAAYGKSFAELFDEFVQWSFEKQSDSRFKTPLISKQKFDQSIKLVPSSVVYLSSSFDPAQTEIVSVPKGCIASKNMLRTRMLSRGNDKATAVWIESDPPCMATAEMTPACGEKTESNSLFEQKFGKDAFTLKIK